MNNWLQNIKGQLSETISSVATEVLSEVTDEAEDSSMLYRTELQVERKKVSEIERSYVLEKSKTEMLGKKVLELEEQLYSTNVENDAINDRFELMIHDREKQIKALRAEIESMKLESPIQISDPSFIDIELEDTGRVNYEETQSSCKITTANESSKNDKNQFSEKYAQTEKDSILYAEAPNEFFSITPLIERLGEFLADHKLTEDDHQKFRLLINSYISKPLIYPDDGTDSASSNEWEKMAVDLTDVQDRREQNASFLEVGTQTTRDEYGANSLEFCSTHPLNISDLETEFSDALGNNGRLMEELHAEAEKMHQEVDCRVNEIKKLEIKLHLMEQREFELSTKSASQIQMGTSMFTEISTQTDGEYDDNDINKSTEHQILQNTQPSNSAAHNEELKILFAAEMQAKENEHDLIKNQLNCVSIENAKLQAEIAQLIEKIRTLQIQIPHPHDKTHNETQTSEFFAEEYDNLQSKLIKLNQELEASYSANSKYQIDIYQKQSEISELREKIERERETRQQIKETLNKDSKLEGLKKDEFTAAVIDAAIQTEHYDLEIERRQVELDSYTQSVVEENSSLHNEINGKDQQLCKLNIELSRLRNHLLTIEDVSSQEALVSEERETELRKTIILLQNQISNDVNSHSGNMKMLLDEVNALKADIISLEENNAQLRSELAVKESSQTETRESLKNLQKVLKELDEDHKTEKFHSESELKFYKEELLKKSSLLEKYDGHEKMLGTKYLEIEQELTSKTEELTKKDLIIEQLENQLEDVRHSLKSTPIASTSVTIAEPTNKIDDAILRQLFLSFFLAEKSKQPEIALVMSKILSYSQEDQRRIQDAIEKPGSSSSLWFAMKTSYSPSLTEEFIRFLEQESRVAETRVLPVQHENDESTRIHTTSLIFEEVHNSFLQDPHSLSELKSIIEPTDHNI